MEEGKIRPCECCFYADGKRRDAGTVGILWLCDTHWREFRWEYDV